MRLDAATRISVAIARRLGRHTRLVALRLFAARPGEQVLEIGLGGGDAVVALATAVGPAGRVYGIDVSRATASLAAARISKMGLGDRVEIAVAQATHLPLDDRQVDGVLMCLAVGSLGPDAIVDVLRECRRVLRHGGRIVIATISDRELASVASRAYRWASAAFPTLVAGRPIRVSSMLPSAGMTLRTELHLRLLGLPLDVVRASSADQVGRAEMLPFVARASTMSSPGQAGRLDVGREPGGGK